MRLAVSLGKTILLGCLISISLAAPVASGASKTSASKAPAQKPAKGTQKSSAISQNPYIGAIVVDAATGRVLAEDKADSRGYPASMLKLMDMLILLDKIQAGELHLQDPVPVSAKASKTGGSQVWLAEKEVFSVEELLFALMIQSANDSAVALAEKAAGSTEAFVELMNQRAKGLGMNQTSFQSVHGLPPSAGQQPDKTTARDFALLCRELVAKHPEVLRFTSTRERDFRSGVPEKKVIMRTHNHLLSDVQGCDGLKTGYFTAAGFSVAATALRNGQRVIAVVLGSSDRKVRDAKAAELIARGFQSLANAAPPARGTPSPAGSLPAVPTKP